MKIKNILISQNAPADFDKSPYSDLKKKYSINIDFFKFFRLESVPGIEFRQSKVNILQHTAIVFSSQVTIDHFFTLIKELRIEIPESMKYFCTTENTAHYLQKYIQFRKRKIFFGKNNNPEGIFDLFTKNKELKYLIPCGMDSMGTQYADFFDKNKIEYTQAVVFKTIPADLQHAIDMDKYDMIVLYSPAGVHALNECFPNFQKDREVVLGALGNAAASAIEAKGWKLDVVAPTKDYPSITSAMDAFLKDNATRRR